MRIGILGSGLMGGKLGTIWARAGHEVVFSYSHSPRKLEKLARDAIPTQRRVRHRKVGAQHAAPLQSFPRAGTPAEATRDADAVLLAVHWSRVDDVLHKAGDLSGKVVVTCSLPMNADDTKLVVAHTSSGAERLARKIRKAHVVSAFGTVPSEVFFDVFASRRRANKPSLVYCGDHAQSKKVAARLIRDVGFEPLDAGPLKLARYMEPFTLLIAQLAYEQPGDPELAYRFLRYGQ